jgi:Flp pilus assembly pilin Flp
MPRHLSFIAAQIGALARRLATHLSALHHQALGQGLVEYGLILLLIMVVCLGMLSLLSTTVSAVWYDKLINNGAW